MLPVNNWTLITRSLRFYWRTHLGVLLGAALGAMVLTGSLLVGDSVKATLVQQARLRVGRVESVMAGGDRFFRETLAWAVGGVPVLLLNGSVSRVDAAARVNQAQVLGVPEAFWSLSPAGRAPATLRESAAFLNTRLAAQLGLKAGDTLVVRVEKPGLFSRDAPLSGEENEVAALRVTVAGVVDDAHFGRFGLQASQVPPMSIFLPLQGLQQRVGLPGRCNLLLAEKTAPGALQAAVQKCWQLADAGLELRALESVGGFELRTERVFLEPQIVAAAPRGADTLTYLVNEIRAGEKATPYSMVAAVDAPGFLPGDLAEHEIVLNAWLAEDLGVQPGDAVDLKYFSMGDRRKLEERSAKFTVRAVLPMEQPELNGSWMPNFPGLSDKESCREWKPGFDMDVSRFRDKDELYWKTHRGTPKAFVNLAAGRGMWGNRWGDLTAIRYPAEGGAVSKALLERLTPEQAGFHFLAFREQALAATRAPVDFGQLFLSFSCFLLGAAAVLTGLLFAFSVEQRQSEIGLLLAVGLPPARVRRLFLSEGVLLALIGSVLGACAAVGYTQAVLYALGTVWRGAVGAVHFVFAPQPLTLLVGAGAGVFVALLGMSWASRRLFKNSPRVLLAGHAEADPSRQASILGPILLGAFCLVAAFGLAFAGLGAESFFGAGTLLLLAGIFGVQSWLRLQAYGGAGLGSLAELGFRNAARRRGRSLAMVAVLAGGVFVVVAVDSFRQRPLQAPAEESAASESRATGTGGFALVGESALPVYEDLNTAQGREAFALEKDLEFRAVPMRVREGDDASCLNLNRALQPRLLGVNPHDLETRGAFGVRWRLEKFPGWHGLEPDDADVVGVVDEATLRWALQKGLGDTLEYRDDQGRVFSVRLEGVIKGSLLQGNVLIAEKRFTEKFPGQGGYRFFLIDAPVSKAEAVAGELSRALQDRGLELVPAWRRLAEFQAVENTYLSIFQVLGALGVLLSSVGVAIVLGRNVLERRAEFGLLEATGFRPGQLRMLVFAEHCWLIAWGLCIGTVSAVLAVWPSLMERQAGFAWREMAGLVLALTAGCVFWAWLATRLALRGSQLRALRSE